MYDGFGQLLGTLLLVILLLIGGVIFLSYKQCGSDKVVTNQAIIPVMKIVTTNINGVIKTDTTYIYNVKK